MLEFGLDQLAAVKKCGHMGGKVLVPTHEACEKLIAARFAADVMGVPTLREIFEEKYYTDLEGGILESFGRLFKNDLKLYVYPLREAKTGALITAGNLRVAPNLRHLYAYLIENRLIESLRDFDERCLPIFSRDVLASIRSGDAAWEAMVPPAVAEIIKERKLFNYGVTPKVEAVACIDA